MLLVSKKPQPNPNSTRNSTASRSDLEPITRPTPSRAGTIAAMPMALT